MSEKPEAVDGMGFPLVKNPNGQGMVVLEKSAAAWRQVHDRRTKPDAS